MHPLLLHIGAILIPAYGALAALGVVAGLFLAQRTARVAGVSAGQVWNLCIVALFAALVSQRLLLVLMNWTDLCLHPSWMLALAMIHHPLLAGAGTLTGLGAAAIYMRRKHIPLRATADALAAPVALGLAFEQVGALMAGAGFGTETSVRWAVTYTNVLAARWSGTPLGVALHPVQAYAALCYLTLAIFLLVWLPARRQQGDVAGLGLMGIGITIFITELWRDPEGRGVILGGTLDGPQIAAIALVLAGALMLLERKARIEVAELFPLGESKSESVEPRLVDGPAVRDEASNG